jgi:acetyltransferase-like isoleucine patch superfamily enzyme
MNIINFLRDRWHKRNRRAYVQYLRSRGIAIGNGTFIMDPKSFRCDLTRAASISIGDNVYFNLNTSIIAHDEVAKVFRLKYKDWLPSNGRIIIGNNIVFGRNVTILKGVTIGDNCIIGFGSTIINDIPENSVAVGTPAKVICTIDEYYQKRKKESLEESFEYARSIKQRFGRLPVYSDFKESFVFFVSGVDMDKYPDLPFKHQLGPLYDYYKKNHKAIFSSFDEFLKAAGL